VTKEKWKWLAKHETEVENYCIKSMQVYEDNLLVFARGRPRECEE